MTRAGYSAARRQARDKADTREDRGLPHHPANDWIDCPECGGGGSHTRNDSWNRDPQCEYDVECCRCCGEGEIEDGHIDPLLRIRRLRVRARWTWSRRQGSNVFAYRRLRAQFNGKSFGYALLDARADRIAAEVAHVAAVSRFNAAADGCLSTIAAVNVALRGAA